MVNRSSATFRETRVNSGETELVVRKKFENEDEEGGEGGETRRQFPLEYFRAWRESVLIGEIFLRHSPTGRLLVTGVGVSIFDGQSVAVARELDARSVGADVASTSDTQRKLQISLSRF